MAIFIWEWLYIPRLWHWASRWNGGIVDNKKAVTKLTTLQSRLSKKDALVYIFDRAFKTAILGLYGSKENSYLVVNKKLDIIH